MKKNKKGFTLIELLTVIVVLSIVLIIAVPGVLGIINKTRNDAYESQLKVIKEAARNYITMERDLLFRGNEEERKCVVSLSLLQEKGFLDKKIIDPRNKKEIKNVSVVITKLRTGGFDYQVVFQDSSNGNYPNIHQNMIPVVFDDGNWVKADVSNKDQSWFDYSKQKWANVVLVNQDVRESLLKASNGTVVSMDQIIAMFVWVPRFKYKLFNVDGTVLPTGNKNLADDMMIDVVMEDTLTKKSVSSKNGEYLTHPAFSLENEELSGFFMAKYQVAYNQGDDLSTYTVAGAEKDVEDPSKILIKPNTIAWRSISYLNLTRNAVLMNQTGNVFGLETDARTHLTKNMEWGAMAYLTNSQYGKTGNSNYDKEHKEVNLNNHTGFSTGCGSVLSTDGSSEVCNAYDTVSGMSATTTGNITGISDVSGAAYEYVANVSYDSNGKIIGETELSSVLKLCPMKDCFDIYSYGKNANEYQRGHLGDATIEVVPSKAHSAWPNYTGSWYDDRSVVVSEAFGIQFLRGGYLGYGPYAGVFAFNAIGGTGFINGGYRVSIW